ncbi:MAG: alkane 1-monooxygenase [Flavobacteriales bacterium]|nr:alkane 1-monooxygenase [Flavobacteriales bacterium]
MPDALSRSALRWRALRYTITYIVPCGAWATFTDRNPTPWMVPLFAFGLIPLLDLILRGRHTNLSEAEECVVLEDPTFDVLLYLFVPIQYVLLFLFLHRMQQDGLPPWDLAGHIATMGILCGVYGINVAHELGHRSKRWERDLARALLLSSLYMHFIIEHNRGHHRRVATPEDPASARYGETVYGFWFRSILYSWLSAWNIEAERLRKIGKRPYGMKNEMLHTLAWQFGLLVLIGAVFGIPALLAFLAAALLGILLLETVNYIEHYGLRRVRNNEGTYGRVQHVHSWNSDHLLGRMLLFELTRHSDHHWKASKKYQVLRSQEEGPQLPTGYPGMMLLSLVPPLFFLAVHPPLQQLADSERDLILAR